MKVGKKLATTNKNMSIINKLVKKFGDEHTLTFNEVDIFSSTSCWTSTGSPAIDYHLKTPGFPAGIIECRGLSRSGKTTVSLHAIRTHQEQYKDSSIIIILSSERRDNKPYAEALGIDVSKVLVHQIITIEDCAKKFQQTIDNVEEIWKQDKLEGKPNFLFIWDSLGATISTQEKNKLQKFADTDEEGAANVMGVSARATKQLFRSVVGQVYDKNIIFLVINHTYDSIGSFIPTQNSYGGKAIEYYPCLRIETSKGKTLKVGEEAVGQITGIKVIKSDFNSSTTKLEVELLFGKGIILSDWDIEFGFKEGILEKFGANGASFMGGKLKWKSKKELYSLYDGRNPLLKVLVKKLIKRVHETLETERTKLPQVKPVNIDDSDDDNE